MPTRNISLNQNASEAVRDARRALQQRREHNELKLEVLRAQLQLGVSALERDDATEINEREVESFLAELTAARSLRKRRR